MDGSRVCIDPEDAGLAWDSKSSSWGLGQAVTGAELKKLKIKAGMHPAGGQD